jgi:hypothetical protein
VTWLLYAALAVSFTLIGALAGYGLHALREPRVRRGGYLAGPFLGRDPERLARELTGRRWPWRAR